MTGDPSVSEVDGGHAALLARSGAAVLPTYGPSPLTLVRGSGCTVWDSDGHAYLDLVAGIAVCSLGHGHPRLVAAVTEQLGRLGHVSNLYLTEPAVRLAERLGAIAGHGARSFFCNSGAEAVEAALKLARKRGRAIAPGKTRFVAAEGSFHGRTAGALSVTGQPAKRAPFEPLLADVGFVPYGDVDALLAAVDERTAAVVLEPVLGEGGVVPAPAGYLAAARAACDAAGALLVLDEVQTGVARTGAFFAWQREGVVPDVVTLAKGLGGGVPIGACLALGEAAQVLAPGDHGSTFGGNPLACAAALAVLDVVQEQGLATRSAALGTHLAAGLQGVHPMLRDVRGVGLMQALVLTAPMAKEVEAAAREEGFLVNAVAPDAVRLVPPLVIAEAELDRFAAAVPGLLDAATAAASRAPATR